jgi:hypothetical protein
MVTNTGFLLRISSIFKEPSHFALYVIPALPLFIWDSQSSSSKKYFRLSVILLALLLSTSSNGLVLCAIVVSYFLYQKYFQSFKISGIFVGIIVCSILIYIIATSSYISRVTYGLFETEYGWSKADGRVYRGFDMFVDLPLPYKFYGVGFGNLEIWAKSCDISLYNEYSSVNFEYLNSIASILIHTGVIGLVLFLVWAYSIWKSIPNGMGKAALLAILASMFSSSIIFTAFWPYYLFILSCYIQVKTNNCVR